MSNRTRVHRWSVNTSLGLSILAVGLTTYLTVTHYTDPAALACPNTGVINCTYGGSRGGIMLALLPTLAHDIPWAAGGLMRCFDIVTDEGTINNAAFPAFSANTAAFTACRW